MHHVALGIALHRSHDGRSDIGFQECGREISLHWVGASLGVAIIRSSMRDDLLGCRGRRTQEAQPAPRVMQV